MMLPDEEEDDEAEEYKFSSGLGQKNYGLNWMAKPTKEGFLYFSIPSTNSY